MSKADDYINLGTGYYSYGVINIAIDCFSNAINLYEEDIKKAGAHYIRGMAYIRLNDYDNAFNDFKEAMNLGMDVLDYTFQLDIYMP